MLIALLMVAERATLADVGTLTVAGFSGGGLGRLFAVTEDAFFFLIAGSHALMATYIGWRIMV